MSAITSKDWGFEDIGRTDLLRADRLERAGSPSELVAGIALAFDAALQDAEVRLAIDSKSNRFAECRSIVQFRVSPALYDWFFNARTGYRAQFWQEANTGLEFNSTIVRVISAALREALPDEVAVRRIAVDSRSGTREERDEGSARVSRHSFVASLDAELSKIWLCEWLHAPDDSGSKATGLAVLSASARSPEKLRIPRWEIAVNPSTGEKGEGLRAPVDDWLDVKGAFLDQAGVLTQIKLPVERAEQLHHYGWTFPVST